MIRGKTRSGMYNLRPIVPDLRRIAVVEPGRRRTTARSSQAHRETESVAPRAGFEPATNRLTAGCSTAELPGTNAVCAPAITKGLSPCQGGNRHDRREYKCLRRASVAVLKFCAV